MIPNPFLQRLGPGGDFESPNAPAVDMEAAQYNAMLRAREFQTRTGIADMVRGQRQGSLGGAAMIGAREAGKYLGTTLSGTTAAALGGSSLPAEASGAATASSATPAAGSLLGSVGQGLGVAAAGYGAVKSNIDAGKSLENLKAALESGDLTPEEEDAARQSVFRAGMTKQHVGGLGGGLAGSAFGPVGAAIGGAIGGSGGAREAWGSYDNNSDRWHAVVDHLKAPWRR